jgi:hypothetical protein
VSFLGVSEAALLIIGKLISNHQILGLNGSKAAKTEGSREKLSYRVNMAPAAKFEVPFKVMAFRILVFVHN